ncbi:hypothetical protein BDFB_012970 [Asbolus verrucosus]|uniref:Uncharacterized protein n=1 Tax=Asbolus verrucosus TaxID=1661398 RepID=A0A482WE62_ASBVE|nr:hypothetical protein BDFB_012970 [Asbolus verrucosus]
MQKSSGIGKIVSPSMCKLFAIPVYPYGILLRGG